MSRELLASQVDAEPAETLAPEECVSDALDCLDRAGSRLLGVQVLRDSGQRAGILRNVHRFRATDLAGLCALAKDVAGLTADSIDAHALQRIVAPPKGEKWGSLKSLEKVVSHYSDAAAARQLLGPLVGAYDLRQSDAHLATSQIDDALRLLSVDRSQAFVEQGRMLLHSCVSALYAIAEAFNNSKSGPSEPQGQH